MIRFPFQPQLRHNYNIHNLQGVKEVIMPRRLRLSQQRPPCKEKAHPPKASMKALLRPDSELSDADMASEAAQIDPRAVTPDNVIQLQRQIGNWAVTQLLAQRKAT